MKVAVTYEDVKSGVVNSITADALALACQRAGMLHPQVGRKSVMYLNAEGQVLKAPLPPKAVHLLRELEKHDRFELRDDTPAHKPMFSQVGKRKDGTPIMSAWMFEIGSGEVVGA